MGLSCGWAEVGFFVRWGSVCPVTDGVVFVDVSAVGVVAYGAV